MRFLSIPLLLFAAIPISFGFSPKADTLAASGMRVNRVILFRAYPFEVRPGDRITLNGSGFSKTSNKVYFNGGYEVTATSTNGTVIRVPVPYGLSEGEYRISVSNVLGSSDNPDIKVAIKVTNNPEPGPTIKNASISGDTVTVIGSGFTSTNSLFTTLGNSANPVYSNGTVITFRLTELSRYNQVKQSAASRKYQVPLLIFIKSEHGINKRPYKLNIVI